MHLFIEVIIRTGVAFILLLVVSRILGKQTISNMTFQDFVSGITLGGITANLAFNTSINRWLLILALIVFFGIAYLSSFISLKNRTWSKWVSGTPTVIIENGKILEGNMRKIRYTMDSLIQNLREKNIFNMEEVEYAVMEDHGKLSVKKKSEYELVTRKDLQLHVASLKSFPVELIIDGKVLEENLAQNNLTREWLESEVRKHDKAISDVFYAVKGTQNNLFFDYYHDGIHNPIDPG
ncbi:YetF domain-containing protein [Paenibacillus radicis (ex Gao et al. 2016)]|uniref:UPF0702 transmembrane protein YdfS n=1 Tax=Paenibacillus radicis (ex Gao et al. 2016) TaxID=1737354 RepID=A0A917M1Z5_9BACL|nr:DUF421 domain-containing protein [Paenibacillus radicis (ex Gao et al. 2016)]GGG72607.1 UPF0702 transmembrane protein YdfS [Paenibacillus radicis (ex Gao et al. 2016)]